MNITTILVLLSSLTYSPANTSSDKPNNETYYTSPTLVAVAKDSIGQIIDLSKDITISTLSTLKIEVITKGETASNQNYQIAQMEIVHANGSSLVTQITSKSSDLHLDGYKASIKPGDRLVITIKKVLTTNSAGKSVPVSVSNPVLTIHIR